MGCCFSKCLGKSSGGQGSKSSDTFVMDNHLTIRPISNTRQNKPPSIIRTDSETDPSVVGSVQEDSSTLNQRTSIENENVDRLLVDPSGNTVPNGNRGTINHSGGSISAKPNAEIDSPSSAKLSSSSPSTADAATNGFSEAASSSSESSSPKGASPTYSSKDDTTLQKQSPPEDSDQQKKNKEYLRKVSTCTSTGLPRGMSTTESHLSSVASSMDSLAVIRGSPGVKQRSALGKQVTDSMRVEVGSKMVLIQEMGGRLSASRPSITVTPSSSQEIGLDEAEMEQDESRLMVPESESSSDGEEEEVDEDSKGDSDSLDAFKAESPIQIRSCSLASGPLEVISEARSSSDNDDPNDPENGEVNKAFAKEESGGGYLTMSNSPGEQLPGIRILVRDETEEILVSTGLKAEMMDLLEKRLGPADATSAGSGELRETLEKSSELNCGSGSPGNSNPVGPQLRNVKLKPADSRPVSSSTLEVLKPIAVELNADPEHKRSSFYAEIEVLAEEEEEPKQQDGVSSGGEEEII